MQKKSPINVFRKRTKLRTKIVYQTLRIQVTRLFKKKSSQVKISSAEKWTTIMFDKASILLSMNPDYLFRTTGFRSSILYVSTV